MSSNMLMLRWISLNPNLGGRGLILLPYWFSLDSSETVKVITLAFCRIQQHCVKDVRAKFFILQPPQSSDIGQNSDRFFSDFRISGESLIKKIRNKVKKNWRWVDVRNFDINVSFPICGQFEAIRKPDSRRTFCKT